MAKAMDITGQKFNSLTAIKYDGCVGGNAIWLWQCDCGNQRKAYASYVKIGDTKSCGCVKWKHIGHPIHGGSKTRLYKTWLSMRERCKNPNNQEYKYYGDRGIGICEDWNDFPTFKKWAIESGYTDNLTIDRINVNGNYSPVNCRWATMKEQCQNKRNTMYFEISGVKKSIIEWSEILGVNYNTARSRRSRGKQPFTERELQRYKVN